MTRIFDRSRRAHRARLAPACAFLLAAWLCAAPLAAQEGVAPPGTAAHDRVAAVVLDGETLFQVRGVSAYPAERRAADIRARIVELARDRDFDPATLSVVEGDEGSRIMAGDRIVLRVVDADAELENVERHLLAAVLVANVREAIVEYRAVRSMDRLLGNALVALGATAVFLALLWAARRVFRWLLGWAGRRVRRGMRELASKSRNLFNAGQMWSVAAGGLRLARLLTYLLLTYFYLNTVLSLFPWTRPAASVLLHVVLDPLRALGTGFVAELPNLAFLVVLWFVVRYVLKLVRAFFVSVEHGLIELESFDRDWAMPTFKLVRLLIVAFSLVIAYPYIPGSDSLAFKGVSVFLGVLLSLGSSSFVSNTIAGLTMTYRGAFREGDRIRVGETEGVVEDMKLMVTRVRTPKNESVVIPNSNILSMDVTNYSQLAQTEGLLLHTPVGIGYDTPWRQVEAMLIEAARRTEGLDHAREPFVLQTVLGDFAATYELNAWCRDPLRMPRLYSAMHANIQDVFNENGVQIMSPAYVADPAQPKVVPPEHWYEPPARKPE
jgi:small-conductance mechanosensitive channel